MLRTTSGLVLLLVAATVFISIDLSSRGTYAQATPPPMPVATPTPTAPATTPPWPDAKELAAERKERQDEKLGLDIAITEIIKEATANGKQQEELAQTAVPKLAELEKAVAAEKRTEGEIDIHDGACHKGELPKAAYDACMGEHDRVWSKYRTQVAARKSIVGEILPLQRKLKELADKDKEYERQFNAAHARIAELEKQMGQLADLEKTIQGCEPLWKACRDKRNCKPAFQQLLNICFSQIWDKPVQGLALKPKPQPPFAATPNSGAAGDGSEVDTRGVQKMTAEERKAAQALPASSKKIKVTGAPPPTPTPEL